MKYMSVRIFFNFFLCLTQFIHSEEKGKMFYSVMLCLIMEM